MSIETTKSGRKMVRVMLNGRRRSAGTVDTHEAAVLLERDTVDERDKSGAPGLEAIGAAWLDRREKDGVRGVRVEVGRWRTHVAGTALGRTPPELVTRAIVEAWIRALQEKRTATRYQRSARPLSPKTIREVIALMRMALDAAGVRPNPVGELRELVKRVTRRRASAATVEPWTHLDAAEQAALLEGDRVDEPTRLMIAFAVHTGLRQGEQMNLELRDVHLEGDAPHVVVRFGAKRQPPKNGRIRRVYLAPRALTVAKRWLEVLPTWAPRNPLGLAFPTRGGSRCACGKTPLVTSVKHKKVDGFRAALRAAGIERAVRWHDLRHTCASSLVSGLWGRRWTLDEVREHLGHTSLQSTMRYAHLGDTAIKRAAAETVVAAPPAAPAPEAGATTATSAAVGRSIRRERIRARWRNRWVGRPGLEPGANGLKARGYRLDLRALAARIGSLDGNIAARARIALDLWALRDPFAPAMMARLLEELLERGAANDTYADVTAAAEAVRS